MFLYQLTNKTKNKRFVGLAINYQNPVEYHKARKIIPPLYDDLRMGDVFEYVILARPRSLNVAERLEEQYIKTLKPEYNV
jgi:hypothetical protein